MGDHDDVKWEVPNDVGALSNAAHALQGATAAGRRRAGTTRSKPPGGARARRPPLQHSRAGPCEASPVCQPGVVLHAAQQVGVEAQGALGQALQEPGVRHDLRRRGAAGQREW